MLILLITLSKLITANCVDSCLLAATINSSATDSCCFVEETKSVEKEPSHLRKTLNKNYQKKIIAAIAAFPFPFGFVGAHRVIMGTKPWVPLVYVATFGGCFGILPMIDFFVILFEKNIEKFENDPNVIMWAK